MRWAFNEWRGGGGRMLGLMMIGCFFAWGSSGLAHDFMKHHVQHKLDLRVGARYIDLEVTLVFFEEPSLIERRRMDANGDGRLSIPEQKEYLKGIAKELENGIELRVDGEAVELFRLYEPEVILSGAPEVVAGHHLLKVYYFTETPSRLSSGSRLRIEDRLWEGTLSHGLISMENDGKGWITAVERSGEIAKKRKERGLVYHLVCREPTRSTAEARKEEP